MLRNLFKVVLIAVLSVALVRPARAETLDTLGTQIYAGIAVVGAAIAVGIVLIVLHEKHKTKAITGCVASGVSGMCSCAAIRPASSSGLMIQIEPVGASTEASV